MCVEWRVVGQPGPSATGALRPGLEHLPSRVPPHGPQRERAYPGQPAAPQPVPMNLARRAPRRPAFKQATLASVPAMAQHLLALLTLAMLKRSLRS